MANPRPWLPDLLGVLWVIVAAGAVMAPALSHGWSLGPFDQLGQLGLTATPHAIPHNSQVFDLIREIIPWTTLAWTQVHQGILPLWNPYSALGAPLAFNWQSATFSLPALLGYLVPLRLDYTVQVLTTLVIGGTGMYVLARVMRIGVLGAAMAATVFELSGAFISVLGWPIASVMSWAGWLFACTILVVRGRHRRRHITLAAVVLALSIYAGEPDTLVVLIVALAVFLVVLLALRLRRFDGSEAVGRPLLDVGLASVAGLGLAAPLILPGIQLSAGSVRSAGRHNAFPLPDMLHAIFQTFNGSSLAGSRFFDAHGLGGCRRLTTWASSPSSSPGWRWSPSDVGRPSSPSGPSSWSPVAWCTSHPWSRSSTDSRGWPRSDGSAPSRCSGSAWPSWPVPVSTPSPARTAADGSAIGWEPASAQRPSCSSWCGPSAEATSRGWMPPSDPEVSSGRRPKWPSASSCPRCWP